MCTNTESMRKAYVFNYDLVINYLEKEIKKKKIKNLQTIGLTGGETTICPDFFRIIDYISQKFPETRICLLTNGRRFIYDDFRGKCLAFKKIDFVIPLHGYDSKSHDQITQVSGSFNQTIEGLKKLFLERKTDQKIEIRIVATRLNLKIIPKILKLIKDKFPTVDRVVLIFLEFEGMAKLNKNKVGITYQEIKPILWQIKKYFKVFKDFRLYHFPLCILEPDFWPYTWRTLPEEEITYLKDCQKCLLKKYCLGIHKSYLNYVKKPEIQPWLNLKGIEIKETGNFYKPINSLKIDKVFNDFYSLNALAKFLMKQKIEPTKYLFTSMFFRLNQLNLYNAYEIKQWWLKAVKNIKEEKQPNLLNFYIHIPFCELRCSYCVLPSFVFSNKRIVECYLKRIYDEMSFYKNVFSGIEFKNIYIGGGTPSILSEKQITELLSNLFDNFSFSKFGVRNFEGNPRDITYKKLQIIKKFGFNRISLGVQSLDSKVLRYANRAYQTYESVKKVITYAQSYGLRINVDLMVGLKGDSLLSVKESFQKIIRLKPDNITLFPLKPPAFYLKNFFGNSDEEIFYSQLKKKINQVLVQLKPIAMDFNYTYPETIYLSEFYGGDFSQKEEREKDSYFDSDLPYSIFGIGSFSNSKIIGIVRYQNILSIESNFSPLSHCYQGFPCQLKDDMRDYILEHFAKGQPVSQKEFKKIFNKDLFNSFKYPFFCLKRLKKIKIEGDLIYFLPKESKEIFIYGLFFWNIDKLLKINYKINKE